MDRASFPTGDLPASNRGSELFTGTSNLIPRTPWDEPPANTTDMAAHDDEELKNKVSAALRTAAPMLVDQWNIDC